MSTIETTTDPARLLDLVEPVLAADPVRGTVLGTVAAGVRAGHGEGAWCAAADGWVAVRSSAQWPVIVSDTFPAGRADELAPLLDVLPGLTRFAGQRTAIEALVSTMTRTVAGRTDERLYRCDDLTAPPATASCRQATDDEADIVVAWTRAFGIEEFGPDSPDNSAGIRESVTAGLVWLATDGGRAVAMAARRGPMLGVARTGPVYTPPEHRSHGYGSAATAASTASILAEGAVPVLFTNLANPTSNKIYQALGYRPVCDRLSIDLLPAH